MESETPMPSALKAALSVLIALGISFVFFAVWAQPQAADDWYVGWQLADAGSISAFLKQMYFGWSGRMLIMVVAGFVLDNPITMAIFKVLIVPFFLVLSACVHYLATGVRPGFGPARQRGYWLTAAVLWLGIPVASETVVQLTGACAYLTPAVAGFAFLCLLKTAYQRAQTGKVQSRGWLVAILWLLLGIAVGTANEQLFAGVAVMAGGWIWLLFRDKKLSHLPPEMWLGLAGLGIGVVILLLAPGNYVRMNAQTEGTDRILTMAGRFAMYLGGAYFGLGTADTGRALWLGLAVLILGGSLTLSGHRAKEAMLGLLASLATLAPMLLLVNFASPRTSFFAVIFLVMAVRTATPDSVKSPQRHASALVAFALAFLVIIDGFVGWAANKSLQGEEAARLAIIQQAVTDGKNEAVVPYLATIPSRLTFMLNPEHDKLYVLNMSRRQGLASGRHDDSPGTPRPYTLNTLKKLKNLL